MSLPASVRADSAAVEDHLASLFESLPGPAEHLVESMRYATMNGGKRLRACLVLAAARLAGGGQVPDGAIHVAAAVECLHAYSLVHDDLPAMDDSDTRRGIPACHIAFDGATAILAGDALQTLAFGILADPGVSQDAAIRARLMGELATAAGITGMAGGQMLDLEAESSSPSLDEVRQMQAMKTGALIQFAAVAGGVHGGASASLEAALADYSRDLGLAFQIADDLLDVEGDVALAGKALGKDAAAGKETFVSLLGVEAARERAHMLVDQAKDHLRSHGAEADLLRAIADYIVERDR